MKFLELSPDVTEECCCDFGTVEIELLIVNHKLKFYLSKRACKLFADTMHVEYYSGCSGLVVEVAGSTHTRSSAGNLEQVANLLCAQANSASAGREISSSYGYTW